MVRLKSTRDKMTIIDINGTEATCEWIYKGKRQEEKFQESSLKRVIKRNMTNEW
ncbi:hypothetical protein [Sulfurimonas sp.]|uniref:hypothetical protein n=1 Tax=Sulfurimonas sp. TaxID=2022749 RepID=UPI0025EE844D|nr:hypothetical protein [Sulfurimonas sp.]